MRLFVSRQNDRDATVLLTSAQAKALLAVVGGVPGGNRCREFLEPVAATPYDLPQLAVVPTAIMEPLQQAAALVSD